MAVTSLNAVSSGAFAEADHLQYQRRAILLLWMSTEPRGTLVGVKLSYHFSPSQSLLVSEGGVLAEFSTAGPRTCDPRPQTQGYAGKSRDRLLALWEL